MERLSQVIIWRSKVDTETEIKFPDSGRRSWRRTIEVTPFEVHWYHEVRWEKDGVTSEWRQFEGKNIKIDWSWKFESDHCWYDGPHCWWRVGPLHIYWPRNNCKKCHEDLE